MTLLVLINWSTDCFTAADAIVDSPAPINLKACKRQVPTINDNASWDNKMTVAMHMNLLYMSSHR